MGGGRRGKCPAPPCLNRRRRRGSTRAAQQASAVACSACVPLAAPGRSGGRARGGTGLGAGLAPLRLHLQVLRVDRALASSQLPRLQGVDVAAAVPPQPAEPRGAGPLCAGAAEARGAARRVRRAPHSPEGPPAPPSSPCNTCGLSPGQLQRFSLRELEKGSLRCPAVAKCLSWSCGTCPQPSRLWSWDLRPKKACFARQSTVCHITESLLLPGENSPPRQGGVKEHKEA